MAYIMTEAGRFATNITFSRQISYYPLYESFFLLYDLPRIDLAACGEVTGLLV
jgi:hypothetical protein